MAIDIFNPPTQEESQQPVTTVASTTPTPNQRIEEIERQRDEAIADIDSRYNEYLQALNEEKDAAGALFTVADRHNVVDPRVVRAKRALGSLYDAVQIIGATSTMLSGGKATPPAPTLTQTAARQNAEADALQARQTQANNLYDEAVREANRARATSNLGYDREARLLNQQRGRDIGEVEKTANKAQESILTQKQIDAVKREEVKAKAKARSGGGSGSRRSSGSSGTEINTDNTTYTIPKKSYNSFSTAIIQTARDYGIDPEIYFPDIPNPEIAIVRAVLNDPDSFGADFYGAIVDILNMHAISSTEKTKSHTVKPKFAWPE